MPVWTLAPSRAGLRRWSWLALLLCVGASEAHATSAATSRELRDPPGATETTEAAPHPLVQIVTEYRRAVARRDTAALRRLQAPGARVWFEKREGEGRPLDPTGKGPWADWDRFFRSRAEALEFHVEARSVRVTNRETNDWHRLIEREPVPYFIFYFLDAQGRIEGKLVQAIPSSAQPPDRLPEFQAWAAAKHPGLLEELMPDGRIDPALENARVWKARLLEWRAAAGLPSLDEEEP